MTAEGWRTLLPAPAHLTVRWATEAGDGRVAAMTEDGAHIVDGERWALTRLPLREPAADAFEVRDCHIVRRSDGRDFGIPQPHSHQADTCTERLRATHVFADADGNPIASVGPGHVLRWKRDRRRMGHDYRDDSGGVALIVSAVGSGWQSVGGAVPPELVGVVALDPPILVGRMGDVAALEDGVDMDRARPIVTTPRPRPLLVLELADELLIVRSDGVWRGSVQLELDPPTQTWLERIAQTPDHVRRVLGASLHGGAIIGAGTGLLLVEGNRSTFIDLGESGRTPGWVGEVWGLTSDEAEEGHHRWVMLTHNGVVVRGEGARWRRIGHLGETQSQAEVSHPIGAFRGSDGKARFVDSRFEMLCLTGTTLDGCGPAVGLRERRTTSLSDGLLVDDQSIDLHLVTEAGSRELPLPLPQLRHAFLAGRADAIYALTDGIVQRLGGSGWQATASLPDGPDPCVFAVTEDTLIVGRQGGQMLARPMPQGPQP